MFGDRLIPGTLIGIALAAFLYIMGGMAVVVGFLVDPAPTALAVIGFAVPTAIGLNEDRKESAAAKAAAKPA
ncbi:hypothetical protein MUP77_13450 [Candidatus Bathyarchaeota archaeon]|nr:hypothetical protein [Candidatus Bathyarchaeota archaeon]